MWEGLYQGVTRNTPGLGRSACVPHSTQRLDPTALVPTPYLHGFLQLLGIIMGRWHHKPQNQPRQVSRELRLQVSHQVLQRAEPRSCQHQHLPTCDLEQGGDMEGGDGGSTWMQGSWEPVYVLADVGFTVWRKPKRVGEKNQAGGRPACSPWRQEAGDREGKGAVPFPAWGNWSAKTRCH